MKLLIGYPYFNICRRQTVNKVRLFFFYINTKEPSLIAILDCIQFEAKLGWVS